MGMDDLACDVLIIGAGPVGGLLAAVLAQNGRTVVLAERGILTTASNHADTRGYALSYGSTQILDDLGYWQELQARAAPITDIHVSRAGAWGGVRMRAQEHGVPALGFVVSVKDLEPMITAGLRATSARIFDATRLLRLEAVDNGQRAATLLTSEGEVRVRARLVIGADGTQSAVRAAVALPTRERRYAADALVFDVQARQAPPGLALERFTRDGPLAMLPQAHGGWNVVWIATPKMCDARLQLDASARIAALQQQVGWRLGRLQAAGPVGRFPLTMVQPQAQIAERVVLVGNAAHALHPVAGQGLNLALRDVAVLLKHLVQETDPGEQAVLLGYAAARRADIVRTLGVTDWLARNMQADWPAWPGLLGLGLVTLDRWAFLRQGFAAQAMGLLPMPRATLRQLHNGG